MRACDARFIKKQVVVLPLGSNGWHVSLDLAQSTGVYRGGGTGSYIYNQARINLIEIPVN
jgi:hypothetical protein